MNKHLIKALFFIGIIFFTGIIFLSVQKVSVPAKMTNCDISMWQKAIEERDRVIIEKQNMLMKWVEAEKAWKQNDGIRHEQYNDLFIKYHELLDKTQK